MIITRVDVALRPVGVPPVSTLGVGPPLVEIFQIDRMRQWSEDQRAGIEHVGERPRIVFRVGRNFGKRPVAGGADEFFELPVGHRGTVDPEAIEANTVDRRFLGIMLLRAHAERAARKSRPYSAASDFAPMPQTRHHARGPHTATGFVNGSIAARKTINPNLS